MGSAFRALPVQAKPLVRPAVVALRFLSSEVVFVLFQRVTGEEDRFTAERKRGNVRDAEVDPGSLVSRWVGINRLSADEVESPLVVLVDGPNLLDVPLGEVYVGT